LRKKDLLKKHNTLLLWYIITTFFRS